MAPGEVEFCAEVRTASHAGVAYLQKWWSNSAQADLLRFSRMSSSGEGPATGELIAEHEMLGLIDSALTNRLFSEFARRQLFTLVLSHYDDED